MALPPDQWWPPDFLPAAAPPDPPPEPTDQLAANPDEPWWPSDWVVPDVALDIGAPADASAPALPPDPGGTAPAPISPYGEEAAPPPAAPPHPPAGGGPDASGTAPVAGGTVPTGADAGNLFPWEAPGALAGVQGQAAGLTDQDLAEAEAPADIEFSEEEAAAAELESALGAPNAGERIAESGARQEMEREDFIATRRLEEDQKNREWAERNHNAWQERQAELDRERQTVRKQMAELAKMGPDSKRWYRSASTSQQVGAWVAGIVGGILSPYRDGKNTGLDFVMDLVNKDIEAQKFEIEQKGALLQQDMGILGQMVAESGDLMRSEEALRLASFANLDQRLAAEAVKYDPAGTRFQRIAEARLVARTKAKEEAAKAEQAAFERKKDQHGMAMAEAQLAESRRSRAAQIAEQKQSRILQAKKEGFIYDAQGNLVADPNAPAAGTDPQAALALSRLGKVEMDKRHAEEERTVQYRGKPIGKTLSATSGTAMRIAVYEYDRTRQLAVRLNDAVMRHGKSYGGIGSGRWPSAAKSEVESLREDLAVALAKIRDPDSIAREGEVELAKRSIPELETWTTSRNPEVQHETLTKTLDQAMDSRQGAQIIDFDPKNSPVRIWEATDKELKKVRSTGKAAAATPAQSAALLTAPIAAGTSPEAVKEFVAQKEAVLDRWATDDPHQFAGRDVEKLRAAWAADPSLSEEDRARLNKKLDAAIRKVRIKAALPLGGGRPIYTDQLPAMDEADMAEDLE